jgi:hypothetical protein
VAGRKGRKKGREEHPKRKSFSWAPPGALSILDIWAGVKK